MVCQLRNLYADNVLDEHAVLYPDGVDRDN